MMAIIVKGTVECSWLIVRRRHCVLSPYLDVGLFRAVRRLIRTERYVGPLQYGLFYIRLRISVN